MKRYVVRKLRTGNAWADFAVRDTTLNDWADERPRSKADAQKMAAWLNKQETRRNPDSVNKPSSAAAIGIANAETALDQRREYPSLRAAFAAYIVNTADTAHEYRLNREAAVEAFLVHIAKPRKRRK